MSDPMTAMAVIGTGLKVGGTIIETNAAAAEAGAEAKAAAQNAAAAGQQASQAEDAQRRRNREFTASQSAAIGEANIGRGGSAAVLMQQSAIEAELDALNIRYEGDLRRKGFAAEAAAARARKTAIKRTGFMKAAGQLFGQGGDIYGQRQGARSRQEAMLQPITPTAKRI